MSKFKNLIEQLNIDESLTKPIKKINNKFNTVKEQVPLVEDYNVSCDLLFLPETKLKYKYLFVIVDLASDEFDMVPLQSKDSDDVLRAMKTTFKRPYLNKVYASLTSDSGSEFRGSFHKYLIDNNILHKIALPGRHKSNANVESLNRQLGRFINGYMNSKELKTGKPFKEWTEIIDTLRIELNKIRKKKLPANPRTHIYKNIDTLTTKPKYKVGDFVYRMLDEPRNALNEKLGGSKFREGDFRFDQVPRKIIKILYYSGDVPYRYMLADIHQASFSEWELKEADNVEEEVTEIKAVIDRKYNRKEKKYYYKLWMFGEKKKMLLGMKEVI